MLIYVPINKSKEKIANDLQEINNFLKENNLKVLKHSEIKRVSFLHMDTFLFIINTLIILSFYLILSLKDERLLFIGYLGVFLAFTIYMLKIQFLTSKMIVWAMGGIQIIAIQIFFSIIGNKKIENIVKGIILVFAFYYLSVISTGEYMYSLLNIPDLAKNIMIIFQLLSFIFGLYVYRKKFETEWIFNMIQIMMLITFVIIIFRNEMGLSELFVNFYNKIIRTILLALK